MEILILTNSAGTHAEVVAASGYSDVPAGARGRVIAPGESHLGVAYEGWCGRIGTTLDLAAFTGSTAGYFVPLPVAQRPEVERKLEVGAVLDQAFQLLRRGSLPLAMLALALQLPFLLFGRAFEGSPRLLLVLLTLLAVFIWAALAEAALLVVLSQAYHGVRPDVPAALRQVARRSGALLAACLITTVAVLLGLLALVVPGIILVCRFFAVNAAVVLEDRDPWEALGRSASLSRGSGWTILATFGLVQVLAHMSGFGFEGLQGIRGMLSYVVAISGFAVNAFLTALSAAVITALYFGLRVSKEAYDVELLAAALPEVHRGPAST